MDSRVLPLVGVQCERRGNGLRDALSDALRLILSAQRQRLRLFGQGDKSWTGVQLGAEAVGPIAGWMTVSTGVLCGEASTRVGQSRNSPAMASVLGG